MVCMKSSIGVAILWKVSFRAARIPSGTPISTAIRVEISTRAIVDVVGSHNLRSRMSSSPTRLKIATLRPATHKASATIKTIITIGGRKRSAAMNPLIPAPSPWEMAFYNARKPIGK